MSRKLTKNTENTEKAHPLTRKTDTPFSLVFKYKLEDAYRLTDLEKCDVKALQCFMDIISQLTYQQVDISYKRTNDKNDTYMGQPVIHYGHGDEFRIHGVIEDSRFVVIRIDPNHRFHK